MNSKTYKIILLCFSALILFVWPSLNAFSSSMPPENDLSAVCPEGEYFVRKEDPLPCYYVYSEDNKFVGIAFLTAEIVPSKINGYVGAINTLIGIDKEGKITGVLIISQNETPELTKNSLSRGSLFLKQFKEKKADSDFSLGAEINAITGATITSSAITHSIKTSVEIVTEQVLNVERINEKGFSFPSMNSWFKGLLLWIIFIGALYLFIKVKRQLRFFLMFIVILYVGYMMGGGFSINDIVKIISGKFPLFSENIYWYSLSSIALLSVFFAGRFFCGWLCPFGCVVDVLGKVRAKKVLVPARIDIGMQFVKYFNLFLILWVYLYVGKVTAVYIIGLLEPFSMFFSFSGNIMQWIIFTLLFGLSMFISRFYCKYICPLGACFSIFTFIFSFINKKMLKVKIAKNGCTGCGVAEAKCQMRAIECGEAGSLPIFSNIRCIKCNDCIEYCKRRH